MVDLTKLRPHVPIDFPAEPSPETYRYQNRPDRYGERLAELLSAGSEPIALAGPVGCGKSSELSKMEWDLLDTHSIVVRITADRYLRQNQPSELALAWMAGDLFKELENARQLEEELAAQDGLPELRATLYRHEAFLPSSMDDIRPTGGRRRQRPKYSPLDLLRLTLREVSQLHWCDEPPVMLVDGLERWPEESARETLQLILDVQDEARWAVVVPPSLVVGPSSHPVVSRMRVMPMRPVPVHDDGARGKAARSFLRRMLLAHLRIKSGSRQLSNLAFRASRFSGGVPRVFLQLLKDAGLSARLGGRSFPDDSDLAAACQGQTESLRRLLRDGDRDLLLQADGTDGLEVPIERRVRFLVHGLLLEYDEGGRTVVHPAPLLGL